jgi:hypothetical protein
MSARTRNILAAAAAVSIIAAVSIFSVRIKTRREVNKTQLPSIDEVPKEYWAKLAEKKIFFGHKSVGSNIIDGIRDVMNERSYIKLRIVETTDPNDFDEPVFAHAAIGSNANPGSKIDAFREVMNSGIADKADIVFFKFCYVDINNNSDVSTIFNDYTQALAQMQDKYPTTRFLYVTVPVRSVPKGAKRIIKFFVKSLIGKATVVQDNIKRLQFNRLLCETNTADNSIFDLALAETVDPDGARCYVKKGDQKVFVMAPEYTEDGGHLNQKGRKKAAEQLLIVLARIANEQG